MNRGEKTPKNTRWFIIGGVLLAAGVIGSIWFIWALEEPPFLVTASSGGVYEVQLRGSPDRPYWRTNEVRFSVFKNRTPFWINQFFHSGDAFDPSFNVLYPENEWQGQNVLHFFQSENPGRGPSQRIVLSNNTNRIIKSIKLECLDKFLIFDLEPGAELRLSSSPTKGDYPGVSINGEFYDGTDFKKTAVFSVNGADGPLTYHIRIGDESIDISSTS